MPQNQVEQLQQELELLKKKRQVLRDIVWEKYLIETDILVSDTLAATHRIVSETNRLLGLTLVDREK